MQKKPAYSKITKCHTDIILFIVCSIQCLNILLNMQITSVLNITQRYYIKHMFELLIVVGAVLLII
jgi:hypothetical protein